MEDQTSEEDLNLIGLQQDRDNTIKSIEEAWKISNRTAICKFPRIW